MTANRRPTYHAAHTSLRDNFLSLRLAVPIMITGTIASVALTTGTGTAPLVQSNATSVETVAAPSQARIFPLPGYWVTKVMCMGTLRGTIFCGARGPVA